MSTKCLTQQDLILLPACRTNIWWWKVKKTTHHKRPVSVQTTTQAGCSAEFKGAGLPAVWHTEAAQVWWLTRPAEMQDRTVFLFWGLDKTAVMLLRARGSCVVSGSVPVIVSAQGLVGCYEITSLVSETPHISVFSCWEYFERVSDLTLPRWNNSSC